MKKSTYRRTITGSMLIAALVVMLIGWTSLASRSGTTGTNIVVTNNSSHAVSHLYLSPADNDNWGDDLLGDNPIAAGSSYTISDASCVNGSIKVIAEDPDGCFLTTVVQCSGSPQWTITNDQTPSCGN